MNILVTNDDGIFAPGLEMLAVWARKLGNVTVMAPKTEQSAKSQSINIHTPFEVRRIDWLEGIDCYSVDSAPADCVRFAFTAMDRKFDLILSGINRGLNLGEDIAYSGTLAAVFEAAYYKTRAIAFSTVPETLRWAGENLDRCYDHITKNNWFEHSMTFNVNIPAECRGILLTRQRDKAFYRDSFKEIEPGHFLAHGESVFRGAQDLSEDLDACMSGYISITPMTVNHTNLEAYSKLAGTSKSPLNS